MGYSTNSYVALRCTLALIAVVLPYATPSAQSQSATVRTVPAVDGIIRGGVAELSDGRFDAALRIFNQATKKAPKDPRGWFFQGMAFNRLGHFRAAMQSLVRARALGFRPPQIDFEMGWGSLNIGLPKAAITHLSAFEKSSPGNAKTSEFLGRAHFALKQYDRAEAHLREAIKRDPKSKSTALLYLARIQKARGKRKQAGETLAGLLTESPDSSVGRDLRETLTKRMARPMPGEPTEKPSGEKTWFVSLAVSAGYNDNVIGQPDSTALPPEISSQSSNFARTTLDAGYRLALGDNAAIATGYGFYADTYTTLSDFDWQTHAVYAEYQRRLADRIVGGMRIFGDWALTDLDSTRNRIGARPAVSYRWDRDTVTEANYTLGFNNYFASVAQVFDRDGETHTLGVAHHIRDATQLGVNVSLGANRVINSADGADFDYTSNAAFVALSRDLFWKTRAGASFIYSRDKYDNPNSQTAFLSRRRDTIRLFNIQLTRPIALPGVAEVEIFGRYSYSDYDSNIPVFTFDQNVVNIGVVKRF